MPNSRFAEYFELPVGPPFVGCPGDLQSIGYIYVIGFEEAGVVKIGSAINPGGRLRELQCGNPFDLKLRAVVSIYEGSPVLIEFGAHRLARDARIRAEWFQLSDDDAVRIIIKAARNAKARFGSYAKAYEESRKVTVDHAGEHEERRRLMRMRMGID